MKILDGRIASKEIAKTLKEKIAKMKDKPRLAIFQVGNLEASNKYINFKIKKANELDVQVQHIKLDEEVKEDDLIKKIIEVSNEVDGLIVQLPLPKHLDKQIILNSVPKHKDIDGLVENNDMFIPATPRGIITLMDFYDINVKGKVVGVIGQSNLVGKPVADLIEKMHPTKVMRFDINTGIKGSEEADILIVAAGSKNLVKKENIKEGVVIIDVGINTLSNGKISGDVDRNSVGEIPIAMSPVPGGVGPMTVISLFQNLIDIFK